MKDKIKGNLEHAAMAVGTGMVAGGAQTAANIDWSWAPGPVGPVIVAVAVWALSWAKSQGTS